MTKRIENILGDIFGGSASMLVALPSAIAFGIIIYAPLGQGYATMGAMAGIIGTIAIGLIAPLAGGTPKLISAPCAPAAAVLSAFIVGLVGNGSSSPGADVIPSLVLLVILICGLLQVFLGLIGGGRFIKYIPYSVVSGYLSGVGLLIIIGQIPKLLSFNGSIPLGEGLLSPGIWQWNSLLVGLVSILAMLISLRWIHRVPATIISLLSGIGVYWILAAFHPGMSVLNDNSMVIGTISGGLKTYGQTIMDTWGNIRRIEISHIATISVTAVTLAVLLSIDTLKSCLVLEALTRSRHNANRELVGQGLANFGSAVSCGIAGAGTMGATLVNVGSGARSGFSGVYVGLFSLAALLFLSGLIAWVPLPALAGILIVIGFRMIDFKTFYLLRHSSTRFDFVVYIAVVVTAISFNLIAAAGMGILLAILIFLRDQVRQPVVRRKVTGNKVFSKKRRLPDEREILEKKGEDILVIELQGPLFFGTADQLLTEIEPLLSRCRYLVLDMRRVQAVDYTAVHRFDQIERTMGENGGVLIFTSIPLSLPSGLNIQKYLAHLGLSQSGRNIRFFNNLDAGIEWAENRILESEMSISTKTDSPLHLSEFTIFSGLESETTEKLLSSMVEKSYGPGQVVFSRGDPGRDIYFIRRGSVRIDLPLSEGMVEHLATFGAGDFFGDMAFLVKGGRSANAVADGEVSLYFLSRSSFDTLTEENPRLGNIVYQRLASALADRLRQTDVIIKTLIES